MKITNKKLYQMLIFIISISILVALDQYTKHLAVIHLKGKASFVILKGVFEFSYLQNTGAAWGILSGNRVLLVAFTLVILCVIAVFLYRMPLDFKYLPLRIVVILVCAGAIGNLIDRIAFKYVNDFIYFKLINFPVFNLADIYVSVSMIVLVYLVFFKYKENDFDFIKKSKKDNENHAAD